MFGMIIRIKSVCLCVWCDYQNKQWLLPKHYYPD